MFKCKKWAFFSLLFVVSVIVFTRSNNTGHNSDKVVLAYIDPGIGAMLIQLLIGTIAGVLYAFKGFRQKVKESVVKFFSLFSRKKS